MSRLSIFLLASLTIVSCEIHSALVHTTAVSANDFLNSIGVVSTVSRRGEDLTSTIKAAPDYIPRLTATYLHNLTTILANNSSVPTPGNLNYSIPGQPITILMTAIARRNPV